MKRIVAYITLILILITLGTLGYMNRPLARPKDEIIGVTYYRYNTNTNNYDEFMINKNEISYTGTDYDLESCKSYTYNPDTSIIKLDCGKAFRIGGETKDGIIIDMEEKRSLFYSKKESSYNYEFQHTFGTTESMYKSSGENALRELEIDKDELEELISEKTISFIYIKNNSCKTSCTIFNHTFKNFSEDTNIHYLNLDKLTQDDIDDLNEKYDSFPSDLKELTIDYPQVLVVKDNELLDTIKIEINGFFASKYENYAEKYGEDKNENN